MVSSACHARCTWLGPASLASCAAHSMAHFCQKVWVGALLGRHAVDHAFKGLELLLSLIHLLLCDLVHACMQMCIDIMMKWKFCTNSAVVSTNNGETEQHL